MISNDTRARAFGSLVQFPGDTQTAARNLNLDMVATDNAVTADSGVSDSARSNWDAFFHAWLVYFKPIDASSAWNPLSAAAFADQADLEDWRKRLGVQQAALRSAGATEALPASPDREPSNPLAFLSDVKWIVGGALVLYLAITFLPPLLKKKG